jgi:ketosteroid isomerase-like protein
MDGASEARGVKFSGRARGSFMAGFRGIELRGKRFRLFTALFLTLAVTLPPASAPGARAQNKKKKNDPVKVNNDNANPVVPLTDEQQIDYMLSEYLGAWQLDDTERLHTFYSEDVSVVSGAWAAPVLGWGNFLALYQQQRSHMQQVRLDRMNTYIKVNGTTAWACYQWEFAAVMDGTPVAARGQTTFVLVKKDNRWLIAHDHTSVVQTSKQTQPAKTPLGAPPPPVGQESKPPA